MTLLPILGPIVGTAALLFATFLAVRNRTLFSPRLEVTFSTPFQFEKPKEDLPYPLVATFIFNPPNQIPADMLVPVLIKNVSKRKISDVVIELTYPAQFAITNTEIISRYERSMEIFGDARGDLEEIKEFLDKRKGNRFGKLYRFRYEVGTLRPGDSMSFEEPMKMPPRQEAFEDPRYGRKLFGRVLRDLQARPEFLAVCRVEMSVLSEMNQPIRSQLNVVSARAALDDGADAVVRSYNDALWLGGYHPGAKYRRSSLQWPWRRKPKLFYSAVADFVLPKVLSRTSPVRDGNVTLASSVDHWKSIYGTALLQPPGFDLYELDGSIETADEAFRAIGFIRMN